jgi:predicted dithiol-disulfide oxidoreductase (DUF899 family)
MNSNVRLPPIVSREQWLVAHKELPARGTEQVGGTHYYFDMTPLGRQEDWEEPKGRSTGAPRAGEPGAGET